MCQARVSHKIALPSEIVQEEECPAKLFHKSVLHEYSARVSSRSVPQKCLTRVFPNVPQEGRTRVSGKAV